MMRMTAAATKKGAVADEPEVQAAAAGGSKLWSWIKQAF